MKKILISIVFFAFSFPSYSIGLICKTEGYVSSIQYRTSSVNQRRNVSLIVEKDRIEMVDNSTQSKYLYKVLDKHDDGYVGVYVPQSNQYVQPNLVDSVVITLSYKRVVRTLTMSDGAEVYFYNCL